MAMRDYYVYILTNRSMTLYVGVTNNLERRLFKHQNGTVPGFTSRYKIDTLIYFESTPEIEAAIAREKQIKKWSRQKKIGLIESQNPKWLDLSPPVGGSR